MKTGKISFANRDMMCYYVSMCMLGKIDFSCAPTYLIS